MAQEIIDFGAFPDDPTADAIRLAFQKTQNNFTTIFAAQLSAEVTSVNQTPGAGITVNQPTGNVIVSANIACVQVSTSTLSIGRDSNGSQFATITQSSQRLVIDLPESLTTQNLTANGNFVVSGTATFSNNVTIAGNLDITGNFVVDDLNGNIISANVFIGQLATNAQPNITSVGNLTSLNVVGNITASNITGKFANGNSNIEIPIANGEIQFSVLGNSNVAAVTGTGITVNGNLNSQNANLGNLVTANFVNAAIIAPSQPYINSLGTLANLNVAGDSLLGNVVTANYFNGTLLSGNQPNITGVGTLSNLVVSLNSYLGNSATANYFSGDGRYLTNVVTQPSSLIQSGSSNVRIYTVNGNVTISVDNVANILDVGKTETKVDGNLLVTGRIIGSTVEINSISANTLNSNIVNANSYLGTISTSNQPNITSLGNLTSLIVEGNSNLGPISNLTITGGAPFYYMTTDGAGTLTWTSGSFSPPGGSNGDIQINDQGNLGAATGLSWNTVTKTLLTSQGTFQANNVIATRFQGQLVTNAQPNITSVGTLSSLTVSSNINTGNLNATTGISAPSITGTLTTNNQTNITRVGNLANLRVDGTLSTDYVLADEVWGFMRPTNGNGPSDGIIFANFAGNDLAFIQYYQANYNPPDDGDNVLELKVITGNDRIRLNASGGVYVTNFINVPTVSATTLTGSLTTNAQPNITQIGTLSNLIVTGNISTSNILASGNVQASLITGTLTTNAQPNVTSVGTLSNLNVTGNISGNVANIYGLVVTNSGANITGDTSITGNLTVSGNVDILGNLNYNSVEDLVVESPLIYAGANNAGNTYDLGLVVEWNDGVQQYGGMVRDHTNGEFRFFSNVIQPPGISGIDWANSIPAPVKTGNLTASNVNAQFITGTIITPSQPHITSIGALSNLSISGNIVSNNLTVNNNAILGNITAGSANLTANLTANNITLSGNLSATRITGTLQTGAQPNITSIGTLSTLTVSGGINANNASLGNMVYANFYQGVLTSNAQPNITSVGNLTSLNVIGSISSNNATLGNLVTASFFTGTLTTNAQPNITSVGNLTTLTVTGAVNGGNAIFGNTVTANYFIGDGGLLSNLTVANANFSYYADNVIYPAQPNITSLGTLVSVDVTGNITGNNLSVTNRVTATLLTGTLTTNAQPNITSVGNLSSLGVTGNITTGNLTSNNRITATLVTGTLTTNAQPNITSVGNLANLTVTGNINAGNLVGVNLVGANLVSGTIVTNAQPNITSVGTLANLNVTGDITSGGNAFLGNLVVANFFQGDGSLLQNINVSNIVPANANFAAYSGNVVYASQPNITSVGSLANLTVTGNSNLANVSLTGNVTSNLNITGNVSANSFIGTIATANQPNITSLGTLTNLTVSGTATASLITGTITTNAQPNITSVGNLTGLTVTGTINAGNANLGNAVTANYFIGNVSTPAQPNVTSLGNLTVLNVTGNILANNISSNNRITAGNGLTISTGGMSVTGNINTTGNLNISGNLNYANVTDLIVSDPLIYIGANNTGNVLDLGIVASYNDGTYEHTGLARDASDGIWKLFDGVVAEPTTVIDWANASYATFKAGNIIGANANLGNLVVANFFQGDGSLISNLQLANVIAPVANYANYAGDVLNASQPNITSLGTLSNLTISGNLSASNASLGNLTTANFFTGTLTTNAQPNITSLGNLTSLTVNGNLTANGNVTGQNFIGNFYVTGDGNTGIQFKDNPGGGFGDGAFIKYYAYSGEKTLLEINVSNDGNSAQGPDYIWLNASGGTTVQNQLTANFFSGDGSNISNVSGPSVTGQVANAIIAGTVYTNSQPNITSLGNLTSLTVTGNINSGNASLGNLITANFFTGTLRTNAQPNITSVGNLISLQVDGLLSTGAFSLSGNLTSGNANLGNLAEANYFKGIITTNAQPNITSVGTLTNLTVSGNVYANSGTIGANLLTGNLITGTLTTVAQPNVTSLGNLTGLTVSNASGVVDFITTANIKLGAVSNLKITGGSANYVLITDGAGNLNFVQPVAAPVITDNTTTNATYYPVYATSASGDLTIAGISTTKLSFNPSTGEMTATNFNSLSDENAKTNVTQITNAIEIIKKLEGVNFDWLDGGSSHGFIAQLVEKILPNAVSTVNGKKTINYSAIIPFLVETVKAQNIIIENNTKEINELKQLVNKIIDKIQGI